MSAVESVIARVLFWGGVLGISLMLLGLIAFAVRGHEPLDITRMTQNREAAHAIGVFTSLPAVRRGLQTRPVDPLAITAVGILLLLVTPVIAVVAAIPAFLAAGDGPYAVIAALLAAMLIGSLLLGSAAGA